MANNSTKPATLYILTLSNRGNPDYGQDPAIPVPGTGPDQEVTVTDLAQASVLCRKYIDSHVLGAGNWSGGHVKRLDGTPVAHVAYNGRVFDVDRKSVLLEATVAS